MLFDANIAFAQKTEQPHKNSGDASYTDIFFYVGAAMASVYVAADTGYKIMQKKAVTSTETDEFVRASNDEALV